MEKEKEDGKKDNPFRCSACWHKLGFQPYRLDCEEHNSFACHYMKNTFSHEHGQTIDNSAFLLHKISSFYQNSELSDITIQVGCAQYQAHKLILCASSEVFKIMLTNHSWSDYEKSIIILEEEDECVHVFEYFLKYLYTGSIHLTHVNVLPLLMLADKYNVIDLQMVCTNYMCCHIVSDVPYNKAISWYQYAALCGHKKLHDSCYDFIKWNFRKVAESEDFFSAERSVIVELVASSDLVVPDEYSLFLVLSKWLNYHMFGEANPKLNEEDNDCGIVVPQGCDKDFIEILSFIRFPMMTLQDLCQLQKNTLANHYRDFFIERIGLAMKYHSSTSDQRFYSEEFKTKSYLFQPRNYTNESWSTSLIIENYSTLPQYNMKPLVFSSPISGSQADENKAWEWNLDLYPKGIQFQKCIMLNLWRKFEVSGSSSSMVRMVLKSKYPKLCKTEIAMLISGVQDGIEFIKKVVTRRCFFDERDTVFNIDKIIPFEDLNVAHSSYLVGEEADTFKIQIVVKPL